MSWTRIVFGATVVVSAVGALVAGLGAGADDTGGGEAAAAQSAATATAAVERRDLVERERLDGTLGHAGSRTVVNGLQGTLTRLPSEGSIVRRGESLYEVDGLPTAFLLYGARPAWRTFEADMSDGADVRQLEANLVELGYGPGYVDESFTSATAAAIAAFQGDRGHDRDGTLELGEVVFLPRAARIAQRKGATGMRLQPGQELLATTAAQRVVTVQLPASRQSLVGRGDEVEVEVPGGDVVEGRIAKVSRVAQPGQEGEEATVEVTIKLRGSAGSRRLDKAPVSVAIAQGEKTDVLTVPVGALLAREGGGHGVEAVGANGERRLIPVETGAFADGFAEVSGKGLREGMRVAVPDEL